MGFPECRPVGRLSWDKPSTVRFGDDEHHCVALLQNCCDVWEYLCVGSDGVPYLLVSQYNDGYTVYDLYGVNTGTFTPHTPHWSRPQPEQRIT